MTEELNGCIKVFGSAVLSVAPDRVIAEFGVRRTAENPAPAFAAAKDDSAHVLAFLRSASVSDIRSSRISLNRYTETDRDRNKHVFYAAHITHRIVSDDLETLESVLVGAIEAGANQLNSVRFITTALAQVRADARRKAVAAARAKAELYAEAAGVLIGEVAAIEDVNPDSNTTRGERGRASTDEAWAESDEPAGHSPGSIEVIGRVNIWYRLVQSPV